MHPNEPCPWTILLQKVFFPKAETGTELNISNFISGLTMRKRARDEKEQKAAPQASREEPISEKEKRFPKMR
jgi:hypothetical protein